MCFCTFSYLKIPYSITTYVSISYLYKLDYKRNKHVKYILKNELTIASDLYLELALVIRIEKETELFISSVASIQALLHLLLKRFDNIAFLATTGKNIFNSHPSNHKPSTWVSR